MNTQMIPASSDATTATTDNEPLTPASARTELDFVTLLGEKLPPIKTVGKEWHAYSAGTWQPIEAATLKPQALAILPEDRRTVRAANTLLDHVEAAQQVDAKTFQGFYALESDGNVLVNAANGIVRVTPSGSELLPHSREYNFTRQTAARFNPDAQSPLYLRVLHEALPDELDRDLFQLCQGNTLLPDCRHETAVVCYGGAGTSKSTLAGPHADVLGTDLVSRCTMSQLCDPKSYHLPALRFAAMNLGTELSTGEIAESGIFKTIVSGEPIEARPIYGAPFVLQTTCKLWFLANSLPRFKHGTEAELRRTRFLRFNVAPPQKDVTLKARLAVETEGVFLFMLEGLRRLLTLPEIHLGGSESRAVHERFRISNDPVGAFVQTCCILEPTARVSKDTLREAFAEFSNRHELPTICAEWFFRVFFERFTNLREVHSRVAGGTRQRCVQGVQLRPTESIEIE